MGGAQTRHAGAVEGHRPQHKNAPTQPVVQKNAWKGKTDDDPSSDTGSVPGRIPIVQHEFRPLRLTKRTRANYNTLLLTFSFADGEAKLPRSVASFYFVRAVVGGEEVVRPYTPVSPIDAQGYLTLMVKVYDKPYGVMGNHLSELPINDTLEFKGPLSKVPYSPGLYQHIYMLAGGSGITPMYQMLQAIWSNPEDQTKCTLLFANRSERDVALMSELEALKERRPEQLKTVFVVSQRTEEGWLGETGHIDKEKLEKHGVSPTGGDESSVSATGGVMVLVCGPPGFTAAMAGPKVFPPGGRPEQGELLGLLREAGFEQKQVYKF